MQWFKRISLGLFLIALVALLIIGYRALTKVHEETPDPIKRVPSNAALIVESDKFRSTWQKLTRTNLMWEALKRTERFRRIDSFVRLLDSVLTQDQKLAELIASNKGVMSLHMSGSGRYDWLFGVGLPPDKDTAQLMDRFREAVPTGSAFSERSYDGTRLTELRLGKEGPELSFAFVESVLVLSFSPILVEDAIRHRHSGTPVTEEEAVVELRKSAGSEVDGHLYVQYEEVPDLMATYLNENAAETLSDMPELAEWSGVDLKLKTNALMLNGYTYADDPEDHLWSLRGQTPQDIGVTSVAPASTAYLFFYGLSDPEAFFQKREEHLKNINAFYPYEQRLNAINKACDCSVKRRIKSWLGNQVASGMTEPASEGPRNSFLLIRVRDLGKAKRAMRETFGVKDTGKGDPGTKEERDKPRYKGVELRQTNYGDLFNLLLGGAFPKMEDPWYAFIGDHLVLTEQKNALRSLIKDHQEEATLAKNIDHDSFMGSLSKRSNLFLYSNIGRSPHIIRDYLGEAYRGHVEEHLELYREFQAIGVQFLASEKNKFYNNVYLEHDPVYKKETGSLWEVALDTIPVTRSFLVTNHYTDAKEVFVQDANNTIYLISNTGKILWTKKLKERIRGDVHQIDVYRNDKLQMLFSTRSRVHLLDRKGRPVENFPVELPAKATAPLALFDYDNNKEYRILVPCADKEIRNYDKTGEVVEGWEFEGSEHIVQRPPQHFRIGKKDYIFFCDTNGGLSLLSRRGNDRYHVEEDIDPHPDSPFRIKLGKTIGLSRVVYFDPERAFVRFRFDGKRERISTDIDLKTRNFLYRDMNKDGRRELLVRGNKKFTVLEQSGEVIFDRSVEDTITAGPFFYASDNGTTKVGFTSRGDSRVYLLNRAGSNEEGFPLFGSTGFSIGDLDLDEQPELVVGGKDGQIYAYTLE